MKFLLQNEDTQTAYVQLNIENCTACWECMETCPNNVLDKSFLYLAGTLIRTHVLMYNVAECTGCMKCIKTCKFEAIRILET